MQREALRGAGDLQQPLDRAVGGDDVQPLAVHFLRGYAQRYRKNLAGFEPAALEALLHLTFDPTVHYKVIASGVPASPGAAQGAVVFTAADAVAAAEQGREVVLVRHKRTKQLALRRATGQAWAPLASWQPAFPVGGDWLPLARLQVVLPRA